MIFGGLRLQKTDMIDGLVVEAPEPLPEPIMTELRAQGRGDRLPGPTGRARRPASLPARRARWWHLFEQHSAATIICEDIDFGPVLQRCGAFIGSPQPRHSIFLRAVGSFESTQHRPQMDTRSHAGHTSISSSTR